MTHFATTCAALGLVLVPILWGLARILIHTDGGNR